LLQKAGLDADAGGALAGPDACFAPVLDFTEAPQHPHNIARQTYVEIDGLDQPAPAPRFSRSGCETSEGPHRQGADTESVLTRAGFSEAEIAALRDAGALT
jgi:alpha-methylacyl-CoA racemase